MNIFFILLFLMYLFSCVHLSPTKNTSISSKEEADKSVRNKRYILFNIPKTFASFSSVVDPGIGLAVGKLVRKNLALTNTNAKEDTIPFNLQIIDRKLNKNYNKILEFKTSLIQTMPEIQKVLHIKKKGFKCDEKFCSKMGLGRHGFGICSPYSCKCSRSSADGEKCENDLIYDPIYDSCEHAIKVKMCGF